MCSLGEKTAQPPRVAVVEAKTRPEEAAVALDVGGTTVAGGVVTAGQGLWGAVREVESPSEREGSAIVDTLGGILVELRGAAEEASLTVVAGGVAVPGPFDYQRGVSLMQHKFAALYGQSMRQPLEASLGLPVAFLNDAAAFALGASWSEWPQEARFLGITLGTGVGSGFLVDGRLVAGSEGVPPEGEIWNLPFRDGILEDTVSAQGIERAYQNHGGAPAEVRDIALRARQGEAAAQQALSDLAAALGEGLAETAGAFRPGRVVVGGQIAKAFDLFGAAAEEAFARRAGYRAPFSVSGTEHAAVLGAGRFALADR